MPTKRLVFALLVLLLLPLRFCSAHPMGNFSVNHYARITLEKDGVKLEYFIDLAEIPTFQELQQASLTPSDAPALANFLGRRGQELEQGLSIMIDGAAVPLQVVSKAVIFPPGAGGLPTMKLGYVFRGAFPRSKVARPVELSYADRNYPGHAGWKEVVVRGPARMLLESSAPQVDRSDLLSNYPTDLLNSPPQQLEASAHFLLPVAEPASGVPAAQAQHAPAAAGTAEQIIASAAVPSSTGKGSAVRPQPRARKLSAARHPLGAQTAYTPLVESAPATIPVPAAMHLQPNRQSTARSAFTQLVTTEHLSLSFLLLAACISIGLGGLHALEPGHGKTIVAAYLVGSRGTAGHALLLGLVVTATHTASVFALGAITLYASRYILPEQLYPWLGMLSGLVIAILGGYLFLKRWTGLALDHDHLGGQRHGFWLGRKAQAEQTGEAATVGVRAARATANISLKQLFLLGITGGIIPCPAALVVLLSAFALHRVGFGFFLIAAFSTGLALVLIGFGLAMVYARRLVTRLHADGPLTRRWLPLLSAACMGLLGLTLAARAFATTGLSLHSMTPRSVGPALFVAGLGLVLGIRHSTDTDHVVAISTIVTRQRSVRGAALIGSLWGLGHTITIFIVGCLIILFGVVIPPRVGLSMEFSVALMLILLGLLNLSGIMGRLVARFSPGSALASRSTGAIPEPAVAAPTPGSARQSRLFASTIGQYGCYQCVRPLAIGLVHGLAGSAAVALLVLSTIHSPLWAIVYLLIFGGGTLLGMMAMTAAMALPLVYTGDALPQVSRYLGVASGLVSICFGTFPPCINSGFSGVCLPATRIGRLSSGNMLQEGNRLASYPESMRFVCKSSRGTRDTSFPNRCPMVRLTPVVNLFALSLVVLAVQMQAQQGAAPGAFPVPLPTDLPMLSVEQQRAMDRDLMETTIPHLQTLYARNTYTVEQVTRWYLDRIARYNGVYRSVQTVDVREALSTARREDAESKMAHGPLWGVPIVIKANTAVNGLLDSDGWAGFAIAGHEFIAPRDATVVAKLRAAGAVILGITNMPDFAASDTNRSTAFGRTGDAYDVRFSPGGSSGGTVTAVTSNEAVLGNGTDTGNSIRMPAGTSAVVGLFPTRGMVSIAGIAPLDWLLDNTGPIARNVTDVAIALGAMAGEDPLDFKTRNQAAKAQPGPYTRYLKPDALKGKRFGIPAFIFTTKGTPLQPETRTMLLRTVELVRAAGAEVVIDDNLLPDSFLALEKKVDTGPYRRDGAMQWLEQFGPAQYRTAEQYKAVTGQSLPPVFTGVPGSLDDLVEASSGPVASSTHPGSASSEPALSPGARHGASRWQELPSQVSLKGDPHAQQNYFGPRDAMLAEYTAMLDRFHLDGLIYPSAQMPPPDETMPQDGKVSGGPHSETGWVNKIGIPAITVPAGFYPNGLPFGLEISARPWRDGDLLGWAYSFEQATHLRRPPTLVESGLTTMGPYRQ